MGCGCQKSKLYTRMAPLLLGDDADNLAEYRTTVALMGLKAGASFWGYGTGMGPMESAGWIVRL